MLSVTPPYQKRLSRSGKYLTDSICTISVLAQDASFSGRAVKQPLGLTISLNGDIITVNAAHGLMVETTADGQQNGVRFVDVRRSRKTARATYSDWWPPLPTMAPTLLTTERHDYYPPLIRACENRPAGCVSDPSGRSDCESLGIAAAQQTRAACHLSESEVARLVENISGSRLNRKHYDRRLTPSRSDRCDCRIG